MSYQNAITILQMERAPPPPPPSRTAEQFVVRFPDGMRDRIADAAKANNRSMNAEIVARLQSTFEQPLIDAAQSFVSANLIDALMDVQKELSELRTQMAAAKKK